MHICWNYENSVLLDDLKYILSDQVIPWDKLNGKTILITGATGLIGSLLVKSLLFAADAKKIDLTVMALVRDIKKAERVFKAELELKKGSLLRFVEHDIRLPLNVSLSADYIIHAASQTASRDFVERPVDTIRTTLLGTLNLLELARECGCQSFVYLSSMEVYGKLSEENASEDDSGYVNPLAIRSSYPQAKRAAESLCAGYVSQYGVPAKIVRLTLTFGPGVSPDDNRVFMQFARSVQSGKNIILHTKGETKRDYLYTADAIRGILTVLFLGSDGQAYNLSNPDTYISIIDMARLCASLTDRHIEIVFDCSPEKQSIYSQELKTRLDTRKIDALNNFKKVPLEEMFRRMLKYMA